MVEDKRVLLVRLSSLGDVIFNLPLANVLKDNGYKVTWIVSEKGFDVINNNPAVDEAILAPLVKWKKQPFFKNLKEYFSIIKYLRSKHFDIAIDTQLLLKSFIWTAFCGAKRRIVSTSAREFAFMGGNEWIGKLRTNFDEHVTKNYLKYAEHIGLKIDNIKASLPESSPESIKRIDELLENIDRKKPLVAIAPATTWVPKHWDKDNWKTLIEEIGNEYSLVFTGTPKDIELIEYISGGKHLNLAGKTNILELAELYKRCELLVSLDNGSTHLAWASEKPKIVSIFCCTPKNLYAPMGDSNKYIALSGNISCQPCHKRNCPLKNNKNQCTYLPSVQEVRDAIYKLVPPKKES